MDSNTDSDAGARISVDIPLQDSRLFSGEATNDILLFLTRNPTGSFSLTDIADAVGYSQPTITKAVDVLSSNDLVIATRDGSRRLVQINHDRLTLPDDPFLEIPQSEFHAPVRTVTEAILDELDGVIGIVLYGSVANGKADRRSDIDLWVLVREDRLANQRQANRVRQTLEEDTFNGDRYAFEIDVEALQAVPNYIDELREILSGGIVLHRSDEFDTVCKMVLHGNE